MTKMFALLAGLFLASSAHAINPPAELKAIGDASHACYQTVAQDFIASVVEQPLNFADEMVYEMNVISYRAEAKGTSSRCNGWVSTGTGAFMATFSSCGLSSNHDYIPLYPEINCRPPAIRYTTEMVNDGYDRVGSPINPRYALKKAWFDAGTCADKTIPLQNSNTRKPTPFAINFAGLAACLKAVAPTNP